MNRMKRRGHTLAPTGLAGRFGAFVAERFPFALTQTREAFERAGGADATRDETAIDRLRPGLRAALEHLDPGPSTGLDETTPGMSAGERLAQALDELVDALITDHQASQLAAMETRAGA